MRKPYILMSLLVLSTLLSACSTVSGSPASQSAPAPDEVLATSIGTYENRTLLVPDGRLALTALHKGKDYQGKPMFYVLFELTNTTEKTQNIQLMIQSFMEVSQTVHGKAQNLQYAVLTDSPFQDKLDRLADEINPGETIQGAYRMNLLMRTSRSILNLEIAFSVWMNPLHQKKLPLQKKVWSASLASIGPNFLFIIQTEKILLL